MADHPQPKPPAQPSAPTEASPVPAVAELGETAAVDLAHTSRQPNNPLHGMTIEKILRALVAHYGWPGLAERIAARCFATDPSMGSSLKFLRKTPWAREKVESLYLFMLREQRRGGGIRPSPAPRRLASRPAQR